MTVKNDRPTLALLVLAANAGPALTAVLTMVLLAGALLFGALATALQVYHAYIGLPPWVLAAVRR
jgi:hypothetical protein